MKLQNLFLMLLATAILFSCKKDDGAEPANTAPNIENQTATVSEDQQAGTPFYTVEAEDEDGDALTFSISENDNGLFAISSAGKLSVANGQSLDTANSPHAIKVSVSDQKDTSSATVTINVTEGEEETNLAPTIDNEVLEFEVSESISDSEIIGTVDASDPEEQTLEYTVISQIELIEISDTGELSLVAGEAFDYETTTSHTVRVRVSDGENIVDTDFTIVLQNVNDTPFITTWQTIMPGQTIRIGTDAEYPVNFSIDWGDGTVETITDKLAPLEHTYAAENTYTVSILGDFPSLYMNGNASATYLKTVEQWGENKWISLRSAFRGCDHMTYNATDAPNLENVTDLSLMFQSANLFNGNIGDWDVSNVENMEYMFENASSFNQNIANWETLKVTNMRSMFSGASSFNGNLNNWDVSKVINMSGMFNNATSFNVDLDNWVVSAVTKMQYMFNGATSFNGDISGWDVVKVKDMGSMFEGASVFNGDVTDWKVGNVEDMTEMFLNAEEFDRSLGSWNISGLLEGLEGMLDNSGMTTENYNATLHSWADQVEENNALENITLGSAGLIYCDEGIAAHDELTNIHGWTILGDFSCFD